VAERVGLLAAGDGRSSSASLRTAAAEPRRPKIAPRFLSNPVRSSTHPAPPNKKGPERQALFHLAERVGFEPTFSTVKIKKLQERSKEAVPSRPLKSPDFAVDLAIAGYN